jgi:predicted RNA-binding Zn ribbon-like protein
MREALREVLAGHVGHGPGSLTAGGRSRDGRSKDGTRTSGAGTREPGPASRLARAAAASRAAPAIGPDGQIRLVPAGSGAPAALTRLVLIAAEAATLGTWDRLKVCSADDCRWAFYDRSPTRSGCWCSMQICGSRAKSRAYRGRAR